MILNELREHLYDLTADYFAGATVIWAQEKIVKPKPSLVTLQLGNISRPVQPIAGFVDGVPCGYYPSRVPFEVNLYTKGAAVSVLGKKIAAAQNTAVNDLLDFVNYLNSAFVANWCHNLDIDILGAGLINDVSNYINDTRWEYRAMVEFSVGFTQIAVGATGILLESSVKEVPEQPEETHIVPEWQPTASGGGYHKLATESIGYFEKVEIKDEWEE